MMTINDIISQVKRLDTNCEVNTLDRVFLIKELKNIKTTLKNAGECVRYGRELFIKESTLQNIDLYTRGE